MTDAGEIFIIKSGGRSERVLLYVCHGTCDAVRRKIILNDFYEINF